MTNNSIAILLPVYNGGNYLKESVQSVLAQAYDVENITNVFSETFNSYMFYVAIFKSINIQVEKYNFYSAEKVSHSFVMLLNKIVV